MVRRILALVAGFTTLVAPLCGIDAVDTRSSDLFVIERNKNRNLVQYTLRLDSNCNPVGDAPVEAYWRMLEVGPEATESVGWFERRAYGFASQEQQADGWNVRLRALPSRTVKVQARRSEEGCAVEAFTSIGGVQATLQRIQVFATEPALIPRVIHIDIQGRTPDGTPVSERVDAAER
jgi:hypothetical protein